MVTFLKRKLPAFSWTQLSILIMPHYFLMKNIYVDHPCQKFLLISVRKYAIIMYKIKIAKHLLTLTPVDNFVKRSSSSLNYV